MWVDIYSYTKTLRIEIQGSEDMLCQPIIDENYTEVPWYRYMYALVQYNMQHPPPLLLSATPIPCMSPSALLPSPPTPVPFMSWTKLTHPWSQQQLQTFLSMWLDWANVYNIILFYYILYYIIIIINCIIIHSVFALYHAAQCLVQQECDHDIILCTCCYMMINHDSNEPTPLYTCII